LGALGLNLGYLLVQIGSFVILFLVLMAWVYKPILNLLEKRRATVAQSLDDARVASEARTNAEQEAGKIIAEAQVKANQVMREAADRAEATEKDIKAAAEAEASKVREDGLADAHAERDRLLGDLRGQIAALAIAATQKLIGENLDERRQRTLLDEFFSGIKAGRLEGLEGVTLTGDTVEVVSALPLTPSEETVVRQDILGKLGLQAEIRFRVDPAILGGLVIKAGGKVVDASVAGQLSSLRQSLA
jgi:F-type H+-transporting ATPase subunit b